MRRKSEVVSFKADENLIEALKGVDNRSEFIRGAILAALESTCPLCSGSGTLSPKQMEHWLEFAEDHPLEECEHCREMRPVCERRRS